MNNTINTELLNAGGTVGLIVSLVWAVKYLTARWEQSQSKIVSILEMTLSQNTEALLLVAEALRGVSESGRGSEEFRRAAARVAALAKPKHDTEHGMHKIQPKDT
jgi:hypothetical protein